MTLELIPNGDLVFKGPFSVVSTTALKLSNSGNERLAYKIKTTAPKRYCVKPNSGFLDAHALASVQGATHARTFTLTLILRVLVMLQPQAPGQPDDRSKHKFMVQWVAVPSTYTDDVDNFVGNGLEGVHSAARAFPLVEARLEGLERSRFEIEVRLRRRPISGSRTQ